MPPRALCLLLLLLLPLLSAATDGESQLAREPAELVARLHGNGLVVLEDVAASGADSFVVAYVLFERPRPHAVALVTDPARQTEWRPDLEGVETLERLPDGRVDAIRMRVLFRELTYHVRYRRDPQSGRIEWTLDSRFENDLQRFDGFWEFFELPEGRSLGRFGTLVDAGALVPAFMQRDLTRRSVVQTLQNCRLWVDSDGDWRP
jgi:hypothetical protein